MGPCAAVVGGGDSACFASGDGFCGGLLGRVVFVLVLFGFHVSCEEEVERSDYCKPRAHNRRPLAYIDGSYH